MSVSFTNKCMKVIDSGFSKPLVLASSSSITHFSLDFRMLAAVVPV